MNVNSVDVTKYVDLSYNGASSQVTSIDAIKNVIKMYLFSSKGDYTRNIGQGGVLIDAIGKKLDSETQYTLKTSIATALSQFENITINSINVDIDSVNKQFVINILFSDTFNKFTSQISLGVKP